MMQQSKAGLAQKVMAGLIMMIAFGWMLSPACRYGSVMLVALTTSQGIIISRLTLLVSAVLMPFRGCPLTYTSR